MFSLWIISLPLFLLHDVRHLLAQVYTTHRWYFGATLKWPFSGHILLFWWKILGGFTKFWCIKSIFLCKKTLKMMWEAMETIAVKTGRKNLRNGPKWPKFHHFWNCRHNMPKHKTKIYTHHISVMINMSVELEKNLKGYIWKLFQIVKLAKMAIKWPTIKKWLFFGQEMFSSFDNDKGRHHN